MAHEPRDEEGGDSPPGQHRPQGLAFARPPESEEDQDDPSDDPHGETNPLGEPSLVDGILEEEDHAEEEKADAQPAQEGAAGSQRTQITEEVRPVRGLRPAT